MPLSSKINPILLTDGVTQVLVPVTDRPLVANMFGRKVPAVSPNWVREFFIVEKPPRELDKIEEWLSDFESAVRSKAMLTVGERSVSIKKRDGKYVVGIVKVFFRPVDYRLDAIATLLTPEKQPCRRST